MDRYKLDLSGRDWSQAPSKKKKGFLLDQISTVGGIAGGILGTGFAPIAGTAAGAGIGSGLGEAIENAITGDSLGTNVGKEAALGAVFGAGPIKLLKGAAGGAKALATGADDVIGAASKAAQTSVFKKGGEKATRALYADAWGTKAGTKVSGEILSPQEATRINKFISKELGVKKSANADDVLGKAFETKENAGQAIGSIVAAKNRDVARKELTDLSKGIQARLAKVAGVDYKTNPRAVQLLKQLREAKTVQDLHALKVSIDDGINFARNSDAADPVYEQLAKVIRRDVDGFIKKAVPDVAPFQKLYGDSDTVIGVVAPSARSPRGINILNNKIGGSQVQKVKARSANLMSGVGEGGGQSPLGIAGRLGTVGVLDGAMGQVMDQSWPKNTTSMPNTTIPSTNMPNSDMMSGLSSQTPEMSSSPFAPQNLESAIMQIVSQGGSIKDVSEFLSVAKAMNDLTGLTQKEQKPLSGEARNRALKAESGLRSLGTLEEALASDPGAFQRQALPNPLGITARLTGTTDVRAATDNLVDVIARMRSGAAITDDEAKRFARLLPQPGDSKESALRKLQVVRAELESYTDPANASGSLEDALMQFQFAQ